MRAEPNDVRAEVCIVGAEIAALASRLRTHGLSVAVMEKRGPAEPKRPKTR